MGCFLLSWRHIRTYLFLVSFCIGVAVNFMVEPAIESCFEDEVQHQSIKTRVMRTSIEESSDYELQYRSQVSKKIIKPPQIVRPRYYATELGIKEKLLVAVLSNPDTISTVSVAFNKTVSHIIRTVYFVDNLGQQKLNFSMPGLVAFAEHLEDRKPFHVVQYLFGKYINEYDYFFLVTDKTYVKARSLLEMVQHISVSETVHMGEGHRPYCSLDGGIILSQSVLRRVAAKLDWCAKHANANDQSVGFGRCIIHATNQACQNSFQGQKYISVPYSSSQFEGATTISGIPDSDTMYMLHAMFTKIELQHIDAEIGTLANNLVNTSQVMLHKEYDTWPLGSEPHHKPLTRFDVIQWNYFNETQFFLVSDFSNIQQLGGADEHDIKNILLECIKNVEMKNPGFHYRRFANGYRQFDPTRGMDYIIDAIFSDEYGNEVFKRLEATRPLSQVEIVPMPYTTENNRVNLILPVKIAALNTTELFLHHYADICMARPGNVFLTLVFLCEEVVEKHFDPFKKLKDLALAYTLKHKKNNMRINCIALHSSQTSVSEIALLDLVLKKFSSDSLILLGSPLMEIRDDYLNRVRMNTVLRWQVFSPIPFTAYHPLVADTKNDDATISRKNGHIDVYNYKHISFFAGDYFEARKAIRNILPQVRTERDIPQHLKIQSKLKEYNTVYTLFVRQKQLHVMRAVEPTLKTAFETMDCGSGDEECFQAQAASLGTRSQLSQIIIDYRQ